MHHRQGHRGGCGPGFFRRGFPSREDWLEHLEAYRLRLEEEAANVAEIIERLKGEPKIASV